jgi:hypothetical protein
MSQTTTTSPLTVVLVHGTFADSSSWAGVIERLHAKSTKVIAAANPLRGLKSDSAYVAGLIDEISGPVLAVGWARGDDDRWPCFLQGAPGNRLDS